MEKYSQGDNVGNIKISDEVVATIAQIAANEVEGVVSGDNKTTHIDLKGIISKKNLVKGVKVEMKDGKVIIDLFITVKYGSKISDIASAVQDNVLNAATNYTGLDISKVNVHVTGIVFPKEVKEDAAK